MNRKKQAKKNMKPPPGFEPGISCLLDRRFNQLSHGGCCILGVLRKFLYHLESFAPVPADSVWPTVQRPRTETGNAQKAKKN